MIENLPDYPQAKHLAEALWRQEGRARGAALIVGAGVSTMAQIASENTPRPPLWSDLTRSLKKHLYPIDESQAPSDSLRLAQEFQSYFGQAALNSHLREQIADSAWFPSPAHKRLLQLPWADVLTTNYDTLLERAAAQIFTPAYDFVRSAADLVHARQPRIVKLHGSIGDNTPLILTEEDYRTYPSRNAAMVNLARQIFIENELCLLEFSGADPNFLQWTGWVRDNLQGSHRRIYLVGVLGLSPSARRLLEERNIVPIDLTDLVKNLPNSDQHAAATVLFLEFLEKSKPTPFHEWLICDDEYKAFVKADSQSERERLAALENLRSRSLQWHKERIKYPGWIICSEYERGQLLKSCKLASSDMCCALSSMEQSEKEKFLIEFVWRCRTALYNLNAEQENCLEQFVQLHGSSSLSTSQVECALLLLTNYRDAGDSQRFTDLVKRMHRSHFNPDQRSRFNYEQALFARELMQLDELLKKLESVDGEDPMWKLRRAALACDLNMWDYVRQQWIQANIDIGRREQADRNSIWVRSRRAMLNFVTSVDVENREGWSYAELRVRDFHDRMLNCYPWDYADNAREKIQRVHMARQTVRDETRHLKFSPGTFRNSYIYGVEIEEVLGLRREIKRWMEWGGIPSRFKSVTLTGLLSESVALDAEFSLPWIFSMIRGINGANENYFDQNFTRLTLAKFPKEIRDEAISKLLSVCDFWLKRVMSGSDEGAISANQISLGEAMLLLSRIIVAADVNNVKRCLEFAFYIAENNRYIEWRQYDALGNLFERAMSALEVHDVDIALRCVEMPLPSEVNEGYMNSSWPEPASWICKFPDQLVFDIPTAKKGRVKKFLDSIGIDRHGIDGERIFLRLKMLLRLGLLSSQEREFFADRLWSNLDQNTPPLPVNFPFRIHALREFPAPVRVNVSAVVRDRVFSISKHEIFEENKIIEMLAAASSVNPLLPDSSVAILLLDEYLQIDPRLTMWLKGSGVDLFGSAKSRKYWLGLVLGRALVPAIESKELTSERLGKIIGLMDEINSASAVVALPYFSQVNPHEVINLICRVQAALLSEVDDDVLCGAEAIRIWLCTDNLRATLTKDYVYQLEEILLAASTAMSGKSSLAVIEAMHTVFAKELPVNADRLTKVVKLLLKRTRPDNVRPRTESEAFFSLVRAEVLRISKKLLNLHGVKSDELQAALDSAKFDPLPEIRFALNE